MRIISGKFKNKKLYFPKNLKTRPLKDSVKENIFNILNHSNNINIEIKNSNVIDLYAGTGSFGLECLSRGTSRVFFVENDLYALKNLKKNIEDLNIAHEAIIYSQDVFKFLDTLVLQKKFDLAFLDPPYTNKTYVKIFKILKKKDIMNKNHVFILHKEKNSTEDINQHLNIIQNKIYGRSEIFFGRFF